MAIEMLTSLSGNFNTQSFDIDHEGVTTNVASKYEPIPDATNVLAKEAAAQITEVAATAENTGADATVDLANKADFSLS